LGEKNAIKKHRAGGGLKCKGNPLSAVGEECGKGRRKGGNFLILGEDSNGALRKKGTKDLKKGVRMEPANLKTRIREVGKAGGGL